MQRFIPTIKYSLLQGSFWMSFCVVYTYASVFLLFKGYSNFQIGIIIAIAGMISVILQPVVAGLADRGNKITIRTLIMLLTGIVLGCGGILSVTGLYFLWYSLFYGILLATHQMITPLINAVGMECINRGISVNFGLARGIGSMAYAFMSFLAGNLIEHFSAGAIPILILGCYIFILVAAWQFRFHLEEGRSKNNIQSEEEKSKNNLIRQERNEKKAFFVSHKKFFLLLIGVVLLFITHNMLNNYLFQIMVFHNGGSREMGIAAGIAAALELPVMAVFSVVVRKISSGNLLKISGIFFTVKAFLMFTAPGTVGIYLAQVVQMLGFALFIPASVYYANSHMPKEDRAKGQAFMTAANTAGGVFGSLLGGFLLDKKGVPFMILISVLISAVGTVFALVFAESGRDAEYSRQIR